MTFGSEEKLIYLQPAMNRIEIVKTSTRNTPIGQVSVSCWDPTTSNDILPSITKFKINV